MKQITKTTEKISKVLLIIMISISQFSFPLEVLADELTQNIEEPVQEELTENEVTTGTEEIAEESESSEEETGEESTNSTYTLTINGESVTEYTIKESDNKLVTIKQEYNGEEGTYTFDNQNETIDFTNMLYGDYEYTYSVSNETEVLESKTITIHYTGDNSELLNSTANYLEGTYYIKGTKEYLTVSDVLNDFNLEELENNYSATLIITDLEGNELTDTENVMNDYQLVLSNGIITENYTIKVEGDYNNDSLVTEADASTLIDKILASETNDQNEGNPFNILDATNPVFTTGAWENNLIAQDTLTNSLENKAEVNNGEEVVVKYYINGFEYDYLTGIQGQINYNKELLELTKVEIENLYGDINEEGTFAYLLNNYQSNGILMTFTFQTLNPGEAEISLDNIIASTGVIANLDSESISTTVTILDYGKGGDVEDTETTTPEEETTTTTTTQVVETSQQTTVVSTTNTVVTPVALSSNNDIESLTIEGYDISFDKNTYEYSIQVKNKVKSLDLSVILSDENASYTVEGNENFKVGENVVTITVTAEDGSTKTYTIKVKREDSEEQESDEEEVEESSSSKTIIIILIVLVIIGLIYVIFKDDEEDKKESKK